jgi:hypothetical protein
MAGWVSNADMFSLGISQMATLLAVALAGQLSVEQSPGAQPPISVFVVSSDAMNGVTHPRRDQQEIVEALQKDLGKRPTLRLVAAGDKPLVTVIVLDRQTSPKPPSGTRRLLGVRLRYLDADANMSAFSDDQASDQQAGWGGVTEKLTQQLESWIAANREILLKK